MGSTTCLDIDSRNPDRPDLSANVDYGVARSFSNAAFESFQDPCVEASEGNPPVSFPNDGIHRDLADPDDEKGRPESNRILEKLLPGPENH